MSKPCSKWALSARRPAVLQLNIQFITACLGHPGRKSRIPFAWRKKRIPLLLLRAFILSLYLLQVLAHGNQNSIYEALTQPSGQAREKVKDVAVAKQIAALQ